MHTQFRPLGPECAKTICIAPRPLVARRGSVSRQFNAASTKYLHLLQGAVPRGNATRENIANLRLKEGEVVYKCPKCVSIKPERAHHCR